MRVRRGVTKNMLESAFGCPVAGSVFEGAILPLLPPPAGFCYAQPWDSYESIAARENVAVEELKELNGEAPLYPTRKIWLPYHKP